MSKHHPVPGTPGHPVPGTPGHPDPSSPWVFNARTLGRQPGTMKAYTRTIPAPARDAKLGLEAIAVPDGEVLELDVRLESVTEGIYVSGTAHAPVIGECSRCLEELTDEVTAEIGELFAFPDSVTDETTESDELPRVLDELVDIEQTVRDAVVLALPLAPLCRPDCPGLCPECGEKRADLEPDHGHETLDPRWAALRERPSFG